MVNVHVKYLEHFVDLPGAVVVDVGCGDGAVVRLLAERKAKPIGIHTGPETPAKSSRKVRFEAGRADALPLADQSADAVIYLGSFHHIPAGRQKDALVEAHRVLRPGRRLHVVEPLSEGSYFEVLRLVDDQTDLRIKAVEAIAAAWTLDRGIIDEVLTISNETAFETARKSAKLEGIPVGISAGAALAAALEVAARPGMEGKAVVVIIPSFAERYLSTALFEGLT